MSEILATETDLSTCLASMVSYEEIAEKLGVQKSTTWHWKSAGILPEPAGELGGRPVWGRKDIVQWAHSTGRTTIH